MATVIKRVPPPPPIAQNDPTFNRWLHDLTSFLAEGGGIDTSVIPGYDTLVSTVDIHTTEIANNTVDIAANTSGVATNTSDIAINTTNIATNATDIAVNTSNIATLAARSRVLNGIAAPTAGLGADGDWFADTAAKHVYVKVGTWVLIV